MTKQDGL